MAKKKKKPSADGPPPVGEWMVTFSDCMTLLLCFFVMLLSFSSFDESFKISRGNMPNDAMHHVFPIEAEIKSSIIDRIKHPHKRQEKGSSDPTDVDPDQDTLAPKQLERILEADAHRDLRSVYLPIDRLFHAQGTSLRRPDATEYFQLIGEFCKLVPCRLTLGEIYPEGQMPDDPEKSILRMQTIMNYLTDPSRGWGVEPGDCSLVGPIEDKEKRFMRPVVRITVRGKRIDQ